MEKLIEALSNAPLELQIALAIIAVSPFIFYWLLKWSCRVLVAAPAWIARKNDQKKGRKDDDQGGVQ
ncbi:hypothetical protein F9K77_07140 [Ochrobactrum sp. LMG 5442]|nr:hypothetical protein F9K77_07140 [Ochrobactrum sp. LMG 5442]